MLFLRGVFFRRLTALKKGATGVLDRHLFFPIAAVH
jgi:hypothetical protein